MYRTLVAVGASVDAARSAAEYVAGLPDAPGSVEAVVQFGFDRGAEGIPDEYEAAASLDEIESVRAVVDELSGRGIAVEVHDRAGEATSDVVEAAVDVDADAIVFGWPERSAAKRTLYGDPVRAVTRNAALPVVVVGEG